MTDSQSNPVQDPVELTDQPVDPRHPLTAAVVPVTVCVFAVAFLRAQSDIDSVDALPVVVAVLLIGCAVAALVADLASIRQTRKADPSPGRVDLRGAWPVLVTLVGSFALILLLEQLGAVVGSAAFVAAMLVVLHERRPLRIVGISVGTALVIWLAFQELLAVNLPTAFWER